MKSSVVRDVIRDKNYSESICPVCREKVRNTDKHFWFDEAVSYVDENGCDVYHKKCYIDHIKEIDKGGVSVHQRLWSEIKKEWEDGYYRGT